MRPLAWMRAIRDTDLPATTKAVAWAIGLRADERTGHCWPSYQVIADDIRKDRRTAMRHIATLIGAGWLMSAARSNGHGNQSNSYLLTQPAQPVENLGGSDTRDTTLVTPVTPRGDTRDTPQVVTPVTPRRGNYQRSGEQLAEPPVDSPSNGHLAAVINLMSNQHRIPN